MDLQNQVLVTIETGTGDVQVQGSLPLGAAIVDVDLAVHDNVLYALGSAYPTHVDILAIDPGTLGVLSSNQVTYDGNPVVHGEGLAVSSGRLIASVATGGDLSASDALGELSRDLPLDGTLTGVFEYSALDPGADCDGVTGLPDGHLLWWNADPGPGGGFYQLVEAEVPSYSVLGEHSPHIGVNDIALAGGSLWGIDQASGVLVRIDPQDGHVLESRSYAYGFELRGLAPAAELAAADRRSALLYSVDLQNQVLVTIETGTGDVQVRGSLPLGAAIVDVDLAIHDNVLYALGSAYPTHVDILAIDPSTLSVLSSHQVTYDGAPVLHGEGLAVNSGRLIASVATGGNLSASSALGELSRNLPLDGTLTGVFDYSALDPGADCDGVTGLPDGHLLWWNAEPGPGSGFYQLVEAHVPSYSILGTHSPYRGVNDIALAGASLWGIDHASGVLLRIDPQDGHILESRPYAYGFELRGLALASAATSADRPTVASGQLAQNHPNPFSPATSIRFRLPATADIELAVFSLDGRRVNTLIRGSVPEGAHVVIWDGRDSRGRVMPSGVYFYRLKAGTLVDAKRMTLIR